MDNVINENSLLIRSIAKKFYNVEKDDLYQAGVVGVLKALKNYKNNEVKFSSYAYKYIFGEMYELSLKSRNIKLDKSFFKLYKTYLFTREKLEQTNNRYVSLQDISKYLNITESELSYVISMSESMISLDDEYQNINVGGVIDFDTNILFDESMKTMDELESEVMTYRYKNDYTQSEVANLLGLSQVKVSRLEKSGKKKILEYIS